jgi:hypothetical protein
MAAQASEIGVGKPHWVEDGPGTAPALGHFGTVGHWVDVGSMHNVGDALEVTVRDPPEMARYFLADASAPIGAVPMSRFNITCAEFGHFVEVQEQWVVGPDGKELSRKRFSPADRKTRDETLAKRLADWQRNQPLSGFDVSYGSDWWSLACLAAASKCKGQGLSWPPPPNKIPLEYSESTRTQLGEYNRAFVPSCKL